MKERPIIMSADSVRAILDGRKTQTRRVIKDIPRWVTIAEYHEDHAENLPWLFSGEGRYAGWDRCPYGKPGDLLWVRESFIVLLESWGKNICYRADNPSDKIPYRSPMFMPRDLSRIDLEVISVRVERLQDISEEDADAEGLGRAFWFEWDQINARRGYPWESNPWVWVIEFKRVKP